MYIWFIVLVVKFLTFASSHSDAFSDKISTIVTSYRLVVVSQRPLDDIFPDIVNASLN